GSCARHSRTRGNPWTSGFGHLARNIRPEITPRRIGFIDQLHSPGPPPLLDALFARYRRLHRDMHLVPDQAGHAIATGEGLHHVSAVLPYPAPRVARDADIEGAVAIAGQNVDAGLLVHCIFRKTSTSMDSRVRGNDDRPTCA